MKSQIWLNEYCATIGGSRAAAVIGRSPWTTPRQAWLEMKYGKDAAHQKPPTPDMLRGIMLEPIALKLLVGAGIQCVKHDQDKFLNSKEFPFAHALPDGFTTDGRPLEIKWPRPAKCNHIKGHGLPVEYWIQAQHNMAVIGASALVFSVNNSLTMESIVNHVAADQKFIADLMKAEGEFFESLEGETPPEETIHEAGEDIAAKMPKTDGAFTVLDHPDAVMVAKDWIEAEQLMKEADELKKGSVESLKEMVPLGDVVEIRDPAAGNSELIRCYNREGERSGFDQARFKLEHPDLWAKFAKKTSVKTFRTFTLRGGRELAV
jgi:predicted phage-related endonuclease